MPLIASETILFSYNSNNLDIDNELQNSYLKL